MPRVEVPVTQISIGGVVAPSATAGNASGHKFQNNGHVFAEVQNTNAAAGVLTLEIPYTEGGLSFQPKTVNIPGLSTIKVGPFSTEYFNQPAGVADQGEVYLDFDTPANYNVWAWRL